MKHLLKRLINKFDNLISLYYKKKFNDEYALIKNSEFFDKKWFIKKYSIKKNTDPIIYYLRNGVKLSLNPSLNFDTKDYLKWYPDSKKEVSPLIHYIKYGVVEGSIPKFYNTDDLSNNKLKRCVKGRYNYYFLINDGNSELNQHFNKNYKNHFDSDVFSSDYNFKFNLFKKNQISYFYFIVPDKSVVCKDLLPLKWDLIKRNIDDVSFIPDFSNQLSFNDYWMYDSHINFEGGKILSFNYLNYIDNEFKISDFKNFLNKSEKIEKIEGHDLLDLKNYSYSEKTNKQERDRLKKVEKINPKNFHSLEIPEHFKFCHSRQSHHYFNDSSFSNLKVLIFGDSTYEYLIEYLCLYFKEIFFYWDHMELNKELIEWYKPDMILEVRIERFIENYKTPSWVTNKEELNFNNF